MKLHYKTYFEHKTPAASPNETIVIVPGLFGSVGNWKGFATKLSRFAPVVVIDQRNHGLSEHSPENSYFDLTADLLELLDDLGLKRINLCGHSMGGKTAMTFALTHSERLNSLIVLDIAPVTYSHSHAPLLEALQSINLAAVKSRSDVEQQLEAAIPDKSTRLFIMLSLTKQKGEFKWRLNLKGLYDNLPLIGGFPNDELRHQVFEGDCLFLKGADSDYLEPKYYDSVYSFFTKAGIETVSDAGHWLHIDQQQTVIQKIVSFLDIDQEYAK